MNRDQFIGYVRSPGTMDADSTPLLEKLVKAYPYCQTAEILYALNLNKENNFRFNSQLKMAAAYAPDRRLLKHLLEGQRHDRHEGVGEAMKSSRDPSAEEAANEENVQENPAAEPANHQDGRDRKLELIRLIDQLKQEVESILAEEHSSTDKILVDLAGRLEEVVHEHEKQEPEIVPDIKDYNFSHLPDPKEEENALSNEALIDKFIRDEPRIETGPKAEFFDPVDFARHGLEDKQDIVSETLARVHLKQGYPDRAIKIYERLSLLYPEKSSFFAAQIEKIKNDQHTDR
jgi:hypothetical protein